MISRVLIIASLVLGVAPASAGPQPFVVEPVGQALAFGNVPIGVTTASQRVRIRNVGDANARIIEVLSPPEFPFTGPVPPVTINVAPGAEVSWDISCAPTAGGAVSSFFDVRWCDAACDPIETLIAFKLSCHGGLFTTPANVWTTAYADQHSQVTVSVTNREATAVTLTGLQIAPPFTAALAIGSLPRTVAAGETIDIVVDYDASTGDADAPLDLIANGQVVGRVSVHGYVKKQIQPQFWGFEAVPQGVVYTRPIRIRNSSPLTRTITSLSFDIADYSVANGVGTTLAPGASVEVLITLHATTLGVRRGELALGFDTGSGDIAVFQSTVVAPVYSLATADATPNNGWLDFGAIAATGGAIEKTFTITNPLATTHVVLACPEPTAPFALVSACPASIPANGSVVITVRATPDTPGDFFDAGGVVLNGVGTVQLAMHARVVPHAFDTPTQHVELADVLRASTVTASVSVVNRTDAPLVLPVAVDGDGFMLVGSATLALAAGATADVTIAFSPPAAGAYTGTLAIGALGDPDRIVVPLAATAVSPAISADVAIDLGTVALGAIGEGTVVITNLDPARSFTIEKLVVDGAGFSGVLPADPTLAPGATTTITVRFAPTGVGAAAGDLSILLVGDPTPIAIVQLAAFGIEEEPSNDDAGGCCHTSGPGANVLVVLWVALLLRRRVRSNRDRVDH